MKRLLRFICCAGALAGLLAAFSGCETDDGGPGGTVAVYGDFGYVAPWYYPGAWFGGGDAYVHPPYDRGYRAPGHPSPGGGFHPPSIPNISRPAPHPGGGGGGGDRDRRH